MLTIGSFHLPSLLLALCSWSSLYFFLRWLEPRRKAEWHCRMVTVIHAVFITVVSAWAAFVQGPWVFTDAGGPNTPLQVKVTTICLGYFLFDFSWCIYFQTEGPPMLLHHTLSIIGLAWTLFAGKYGTEMMATLCGSEITNPLLQLRWFLRETGHYHTILGEVVDLVFMISFFVMRLGVGSYLIYSYYRQPTDFWGRLAATCIYLVGWMFSVSIFQYAVYKYTKKYRAWSKARKSAGRVDASISGEKNGTAVTDAGNGSIKANGTTGTGHDTDGKQCARSGSTNGGIHDLISPTAPSTQSRDWANSAASKLGADGLHHRSHAANGSVSSTDVTSAEIVRQ